MRHDNQSATECVTRSDENRLRASLSAVWSQGLSDTSRTEPPHGRRSLRDDGGNPRCRSISVPDRGEIHPLHVVSGVTLVAQGSSLRRVLIGRVVEDVPNLERPRERPC
jgi:hypothetical protein